ncbi:MAG: ankyrin repeat domain-containing protein [Pandoraea sp.]|nr:MAG: ankyrin repeat domain-containing protein [Pandoraea sp.]TAM14850.1 MAG: ankyrin repeat domain-containing protein [Pandoraea sp.]
MFSKYIRVLFMVCLLTSCATTSAVTHDELIKAVKFDDVQTVQSALAQGVDPNTVDDIGNPLLYVAMQEKSVKVAKLLIDDPKTDLEQLNRAHENALMIACLQGLTPLVKLMIAKGAEVNKHGWAPLHYAAASGHDDIVKLLLDHSAYIDAASPNGTTPLMMAARSDHVSTIQLLLDQGADPTVKNQLGMTAADFARQFHYDDLAKALEQQEQVVLDRRKASAGSKTVH